MYPPEKNRKPALSPQAIETWPAASLPPQGEDKKARLANALKEHGWMVPGQTAGVHWAIGCVALEITQRCNLDCTLCYLSDLSEAVKDLPLEEVFRRIDLIHAHYGDGTNVQVTGGDPTLRNPKELEAIVARIAAKNMRPALFTNGIKATRSLLMQLRGAGLKDVAFHIDMTQQRKGYESESALNTLREAYITRADGLGLHILFNTTVFDGNVEDVPMLARFFAQRAHQVHLASFQMQADTGRGVLRQRGKAITQDRIIQAISDGANHNLSFDSPVVGHSECNRYAGLIASGGLTAPIFDDDTLFADLFAAGASVQFDRYKPLTSILAGTKLFAQNIPLTWRALRYAMRKAWALKRGLLRSGGRLHKLTFYIHNFMDAQQLDKERCETCIFMTMTRDGPISMCVHNAKRDSFLSQEIKTAAGRWSPREEARSAQPIKRLKGRRRAAFLQDQSALLPRHGKASQHHESYGDIAKARVRHSR
ncbi:MAG: radical SAM protein [Pseudomonadota bacterium]